MRSLNLPSQAVSSSTDSLRGALATGELRPGGPIAPIQRSRDGWSPSVKPPSPVACGQRASPPSLVLPTTPLPSVSRHDSLPGGWLLTGSLPEPDSKLNPSYPLTLPPSPSRRASTKP